MWKQTTVYFYLLGTLLACSHIWKFVKSDTHKQKLKLFAAAIVFKLTRPTELLILLIEYVQRGKLILGDHIIKNKTQMLNQ